MASQRFYEGPTGFFRDVDIPVDTATVREMEAKEASRFRAILLPHKARGAITEADVPQWIRWLRTDRPVAEEALNALRGNDELAEKAFAQDAEIRAMADAFDSYMEVADEDRVREYDGTAGMTQSERLAHWLAQATGEDREPRYA